MYILCINRPPSSNIASFLEKLELLLTQLPQQSLIALAGDLNINFSDKVSANAQRLSNLLTSFNFIYARKIFHAYLTILDHYTTIDYLCTNLSIRNVSCSVLAASVSVHEAIYCLLYINSKVPTPLQKLGRIYNKSNYGRFYQFCQKINWKQMVISSDSFDCFQKSLIKSHNCGFPLREVKIKNYKPWIARGIKTSGKTYGSSI